MYAELKYEDFYKILVLGRWFLNSTYTIIFIYIDMYIYLFVILFCCLWLLVLYIVLSVHDFLFNTFKTFACMSNVHNIELMLAIKLKMFRESMYVLKSLKKYSFITNFRKKYWIYAMNEFNIHVWRLSEMRKNRWRIATIELLLTIRWCATHRSSSTAEGHMPKLVKSSERILQFNSILLNIYYNIIVWFVCTHV